MKQFVLTITPNPALDLGGIVDRVVPNEKTYVHDETRHPGGNGINVARMLTRLRTPTWATGFLGGSVGDEIRYLIAKEKVQNKFVTIQDQSRISITVSNLKDHKQTRLSFHGPNISKGEKDKLLGLVKGSRGASLLVIGGSMPSGFLSKDIIAIIDLLKRRGVESIVDCPGHLLKQIISAKPLLIKPNLTEFQELTGTKGRSIKDVRREAKKLLNKVPFICVSSVEGGALLVTENGSYFGRIPKVKIRSTVGAGDSMVAAMAAQIFKKQFDGRELLRWGLAASAATLMRSGTALGTQKEILRLYKKTKAEKRRSF